MSLDLVQKLEKYTLFALIVALPLNGLPKRFSLPALGIDLAVYFFCVLMALLIYEWLKYKFEIPTNAMRYFGIYVGWQILCLALGLINYEYPEYLTLDQLSKLDYILQKLSSYGIAIAESLAIKLWLFFRFLKDILFLNNTFILLAFAVWHLYKENFEQGFKDICKAILILVLCMGVYSVIELSWLKFGSVTAKELLKTINPYLYDPVRSNHWWPPLLWKNQLRSIAQEPSFFGIISVFCLPFLWSCIHSFRKGEFVKIVLLCFYFTLMIAATNARTAIVIVIVEIILLIVSIYLKKWDIRFMKTVGIIVLITIFSFYMNIINFNRQINNNTNLNGQISKNVNFNRQTNKNVNFNGQIKNIGKSMDNYATSNVFGISNIKARLNNIKKSMDNYVTSNVSSVSNIKARSNRARFANLIANINVVKDYPIMGVGTGLKDVYMAARLPEFSFSDNEVRNWTRDMYNEGVLKRGYPALNKYADVAVQNGIPGLVMYLLPVFYLFYWIIIFRKNVFSDDYTIFLTIAMLGLLIAQISNASFSIINGIIWGLMFCKIEEVKHLEIKS